VSACSHCMGYTHWTDSATAVTECSSRRRNFIAGQESASAATTEDVGAEC